MAEFVTFRNAFGSFAGKAIAKEERLRPTGLAIELPQNIRSCLEVLRTIGPRASTAVKRYKYDSCLKAVRNFEAGIGKQIYWEPVIPTITSAITTWVAKITKPKEELVEGSEEWCREKCRNEGFDVFHLGACVDACIAEHLAPPPPPPPTCDSSACDTSCVASGYSRGSCVGDMCQCVDDDLPPPPPPPPYIEPGFFDKLKASLPSWWPYGLGALALLGGGYYVMKRRK